MDRGRTKKFNHKAQKHVCYLSAVKKKKEENPRISRAHEVASGKARPRAPPQKSTGAPQCVVIYGESASAARTKRFYPPFSHWSKGSYALFFFCRSAVGQEEYAGRVHCGEKHGKISGRAQSSSAENKRMVSPPRTEYPRSR